MVRKITPVGAVLCGLLAIGLIVLGIYWHTGATCCHDEVGTLRESLTVYDRGAGQRSDAQITSEPTFSKESIKGTDDSLGEVDSGPDLTGDLSESLSGEDGYFSFAPSTTTATRESPSNTDATSDNDRVDDSAEGSGGDGGQTSSGSSGFAITDQATDVPMI